MEDIPFGTFVTLSTLKTLAGQVGVVLVVTQGFKMLTPESIDVWNRCVAIIIGIAIQLLLVAADGSDPTHYFLAFVNGLLVALTAMKGAEMIKGK